MGHTFDFYRVSTVVKHLLLRININFIIYYIHERLTTSSGQLSLSTMYVLIAQYVVF